MAQALAMNEPILVTLSATAGNMTQLTGVGSARFLRIYSTSECYLLHTGADAAAKGAAYETIPAGMPVVSPIGAWGTILVAGSVASQVVELRAVLGA